MYRIRTIFQNQPGVPYLSTLFFSETGGTAAQAAAAAGSFYSAMDDILAGSVTWSFDGIVETVNPITGNILAITSVTPYSGLGVGSEEALPYATQGLVRWRTGEYVNGREIRGRTFLPCPPETMNADGVPSEAYTDTVDIAAAALLASANAELVVWSRVNQQQQAVTAFSTWPQWAILRSRRD